MDESLTLVTYQWVLQVKGFLNLVFTYSPPKCISVAQMENLIWSDLLGVMLWRRQGWECHPHACYWSQVGVWIWPGEIWMVLIFVGTCWEAVWAGLESHPRLLMLSAKICHHKQVAQPKTLSVDKVGFLVSFMLLLLWGAEKQILLFSLHKRHAKAVSCVNIKYSRRKAL